MYVWVCVWVWVGGGVGRRGGKGEVVGVSLHVWVCVNACRCLCVYMCIHESAKMHIWVWVCMVVCASTYEFVAGVVLKVHLILSFKTSGYCLFTFIYEYHVKHIKYAYICNTPTDSVNETYIYILQADLLYRQNVQTNNKKYRHLTGKIRLLHITLTLPPPFLPPLLTKDNRYWNDTIG